MEMVRECVAVSSGDCSAVAAPPAASARGGRELHLLAPPTTTPRALCGHHSRLVATTQCLDAAPPLACALAAVTVRLIVWSSRFFKSKQNQNKIKTKNDLKIKKFRKR
jgi:hypothetical protein